MRRLAAMVLLIVAMAISGTPPAWAHAVRVAADPAPDATVSTGPARVTATFNEQLQTTFSAMTVVGPDGNLWSEGRPTVQGAAVSVAVRPLGPTGSYTVNYRVTSADGHVVSGSWSFTLTVAGHGSPGPSAAAGAPTRAAGVAVPGRRLLCSIAGGAAWALRRRS